MLPLLIPYWQAKILYLWKIPIDPWATLVCIGFIVGLEVGRARGIKLGSTPETSSTGECSPWGWASSLATWSTCSPTTPT